MRRLTASGGTGQSPKPPLSLCAACAVSWATDSGYGGFEGGPGNGRPRRQTDHGSGVTSLLTSLDCSPYLPSFPYTHLHHRPNDPLRNRLWFQLTRTIEAFFAVPASQPFRIDLYEQFIRDFSSKLDPLKHASIAVSVARSYEGASPPSGGVDGRSVLELTLPLRNDYRPASLDRLP